MMTGFFNVFKAEGKSSAFVVNKIKWLTKTPCGHMGTLDPLACGVLPVGVGNATRLFDYFLNKTKVYEAKFRFGVTTDTLDREGEPYGHGNVPTYAGIADVLSQFVGEIDQIPPLYSAKSVNGRRGYELAREGKEFTLPPKRIRIDSLTVEEQTAPDEYRFRIVCGGGTYIRSLARDIAAACGTVGYMSYLQRTQSGVFTAQTAVPLEALTPENLEQYLIRTEDVLPFPVVNEPDLRLFHGVTCPCAEEDGTYKIYKDGVFYGLAVAKDGMMKIEKKLC